MEKDILNYSISYEQNDLFKQKENVSLSALFYDIYEESETYNIALSRKTFIEIATFFFEQGRFSLLEEFLNSELSIHITDFTICVKERIFGD